MYPPSARGIEARYRRAHGLREQAKIDGGRRYEKRIHFIKIFAFYYLIELSCPVKGDIGLFKAPSIFDNVAPGMSIGDKEIFGPVLSIKRVHDFEEGLALMNASPYANGSVIYTRSGFHAREFARRTHGGMVGVNVGIPVPVCSFGFTGHKRSFFGSLHVMGMDGVRFYTELKNVTATWFREDGGKVDTWDGMLPTAR